MTTLLIILALQTAALVGIRFAPKSVRLFAARRLRKYANWVSPDNF